MNRERALAMISTIELLPDSADAQVRELFDAARESDIGLSAADLFIVRDLMELSGYRDVELEAIILCMLIAVNEGSICLKLEELRIAKRLGTFLDGAKAAALAKCIMKKDLIKSYPEIVSGSETEFKPFILKEIKGGKFLYFQKFPRYEAELKEAIDAHIRSKAEKPLSAAKVKAALIEVTEKSPMMSRGEKLELNDEQKIAVCLALLKDFVIISGGPGTGKTSIVITLLRCLVRLGVDPANIRLAAPTGRAAHRLKDSIRRGLSSMKTVGAKDKKLVDVKESTVHRLLGYNPSRDSFTYNSGNPLPADVVIIDEVSMIDIVMMAKLFEALKSGAKVVLLGDKNQLPSVEAGAVLADLIPEEECALFSSGMQKEISDIVGSLKDKLAGPVGKSAAKAATSLLTDRVVMLKQSYRSEKSILDIARRVNDQDASVVDSIPLVAAKRFSSGGAGGGCMLMESDQSDIKEWLGVLDAWISRQYLNPHMTRLDISGSYKDLVKKAENIDLGQRDVKDVDKTLENIFSFLDQGKILAFVRHGAFGVIQINRHIAGRLRPVLDRNPREGVFAGMPIMITENDHVHELYNGDVGAVLKDRSGAYRAVFPRLGSFISLPLSELTGFEPAFAITVHKSQGSEYDNVLLALPSDEKSRLLSKEIVYTGLTRARYSVLIYGRKDVLRSAISRRIERESGITLWE